MQKKSFPFANWAVFFEGAVKNVVVNHALFLNHIMKCHNLVVKYLKGQPPFANYEVLERKYFYGTLYVSRGAKSCPFCHMTSANKSKINEGTKIF